MNSDHSLSVKTVFVTLLLIVLCDGNALTQKNQPKAFSVLRTMVPVQAEQARFRVSLTGFAVNRATTENVLSIDGAGDEVFAMVNFAELWSSNTVFGAIQRRQSLIYGDTSGRRGPLDARRVLPELEHPGDLGTVFAGSASPSGGLRDNDRYPPFGGRAEMRPSASEGARARLIPMILWEGELRRGGPHPNAVVILPTIWENDNVPDVLNIWNRQSDVWIRHFATSVSPFITGARRRPLIEQFDTVLNTVPQRNDFDRPIGMSGDAFNPGSATPDPATFVPAVMLLTFNSAQEAALSTSNSNRHERGVVEIRYRDGERYGPGDYTIFLLVERLP